MGCKSFGLVTTFLYLIRDIATLRTYNRSEQEIGAACAVVDSCPSVRAGQTACFVHERILMKRSILATAASLAAVVLVGCGGGGEIAGGEVILPGRTIEMIDGPSAKMSVQGGAIMRLSAKAASYSTSLTEMKWTVAPVTPGAPALVLTDANCASAVRNDLGGKDGFASSTWTCTTSTVAPVLSSAATYQLTVSGKDAKGAVATRNSEIVVSAVPASELAALRPTVVTSTDVNIVGGAEAGLTCTGAPGKSAVSKTLKYAWRVISNPSGLALALTDDDKSTVHFTAPAVANGSPKNATFECEVTDANGHSAAAEVLVTFSSAADSVRPPTVIGSSSSIQLYTGLESQLSCQGSGGYIANDGEGLRYRWVVKTNSTGILVDMVGGDQPTVRVKPGSLPPSVEGDKANITLQCRVTDDANRTVTVDVNAVVNRYNGTTAANTVIANAGTSKTVQIGEIVVLDGSRSSMVGVTNPQLYYKWTQVSGPTVSLSGDNTVNPSFRAPNQTTTATLRFKLVVTSAPLTSTYVPKSTEVAYVDISVAPAGAPRISLPPVTQVAGGVSATLFATVLENPEELPVYFRWTQVSGTSVVIQTPNL